MQNINCEIAFFKQVCKVFRSIIRNLASVLCSRRYGLAKVQKLIRNNSILATRKTTFYTWNTQLGSKESNGGGNHGGVNVYYFILDKIPSPSNIKFSHPITITKTGGSKGGSSPPPPADFYGGSSLKLFKRKSKKNK